MKIGIIGGTGLEKTGLLQNPKEITVETPYGAPSDSLLVGKIGNLDVVLLSRHGRHHHVNPSNVNYKANIWALKEQGCSHIFAPTACGSLKENVQPSDLVFPDQFIDHTSHRKQTFYDGEQVCHISMAEPFCSHLRELLAKNASELGLSHHPRGTLITIEGPRFSTKSESNLFRTWGCDVINMTTVPECVLAREAGICYQPIAMVTDYDCWKEHNVNFVDIIKVMEANAQKVVQLLLKVLPTIPEEKRCSCKEAIKSALA